MSSHRVSGEDVVARKQQVLVLGQQHTGHCEWRLERGGKRGGSLFKVVGFRCWVEVVEIKLTEENKVTNMMRPP